MAKTFTVVSSDTNSKTTFETEATTVGELLVELDNRDISYLGKTLFEGISKAEYDVNKPEAILPHDLPYKGNITSNLVFLLTPSKKKYNSGIDRNELYNEINRLGLRDVVFNKFGRNYTQVSSADLAAIISAHIEFDDEVDDEQSVENCCCADTDLLCDCLNFAMNLIINAVRTKTIKAEEVMNILNDAFNTKETASVYSDDEIDAMFND